MAKVTEYEFKYNLLLERLSHLASTYEDTIVQLKIENKLLQQRIISMQEDFDNERATMIKNHELKVALMEGTDDNSEGEARRSPQRSGAEDDPPTDP